MHMKDVIKFIKHLNNDEMTEIIATVIHRRDELNPDEDTILLSLPRNDRKERERLLTLAVSLLNRENDDSGGKGILHNH